MNIFGRKNKAFWRTPVWAVACLVFVLSAAFSAYVQWQPSFRDPDSYYHLRLAMFMAGGQTVRTFPWLPFTSLGQDFADHHFLYHVLLVPFIMQLGPEIGLKAASVLFAGLAVAAFYLLLKAYRAPGAVFWTALLMFSAGFAFRLNLAKTPAPSLLLLFLMMIALKRQKFIAAFFLSWAYVWLHGGWPLALIVAGLPVLIRALADRMFGTQTVHSWGQRWFWMRLFRGSADARRRLAAAAEWRGLKAVVAGAVAGLFVNPYFPSNLAFYWDQIVQIAVVGYGQMLATGQEWLAPTSTEFMRDLCLNILTLEVLVGLTVSAVWLRLPLRRESDERESAVEMLYAAGLALVLGLMALRNRRHIEYFTPALVFAQAIYARELVRRLDWRGIGKAIGRGFVLPATAISATLIIAVFFSVAQGDAVWLHDTMSASQRWDAYAGAGEWLKKNVPEGAVVGNVNWDAFPKLFRFDADHAYVWGLDPRFLYFRDPVRYQIWKSIADGDGGAASTVLAERQFGAEYVVMRADDAEVRAAFASGKRSQTVFDDGQVVILALQ